MALEVKVASGPRRGRPERPLDTTAGPLPQLAGELRRLRGAQTYRELAASTGLSIATLRTAAAGECLPTWKVTRAFVAACDGDEGTLRELWEDACTATGRPVPGNYAAEPPIPRPGEVISAAQLIDMMKRLRMWAGHLSLTQLNERSGGFALPPSTVSDTLRGQGQRLPSLRLVSAYVRACGLDDDQASAWEQAWQFIKDLQERKLTAPQLPEPDQNQPIASRLPAPPHPSVFARDYLRNTALADLGCAISGMFAAAQICFGDYVTTTYLAWSLALPVLWIATLWLSGGYDARFIGTGSDEFRKVLNAGVSLTAAVVIFSYAVNIELSRGYLLLALPGITLFDLVARYTLRKRLHKFRETGRGLLNVVAVGHELAIANLVNELRQDRYHGLTVVGACMTQPGECDEVAGVPVYGGLDDVMAAVRVFGADTVAVLACPELDGIRLRSLAWELEKAGIDLCVSPALPDVTSAAAGLSLLHVGHPRLDGVRLVVKNLFDRCVAAVALLLLSPVMVILAVIIRLSDGGPALITQIRVGKNGRLFRIYKFRTTVVDVERHRTELLARNDSGSGLFKLHRDSPATRVGPYLRRWSIDELPELFNVLRGDISLVGPRPGLPDEAARYAEQVRSRMTAKPGMTGLWQVNGRSNLSWKESVRLDVRYMENWSFALDLQVLWKTISSSIQGTGRRR